ncbi:MAG: hydroxymethylglutaryl-CoA lyase [Phycisphaeraceae bacterium]|nr:hydroxymethylglutaryl-CoA lyase [Phycisphaeraceae bacterium]
MADRVRITDVAPRDGLQNEPGVIATARKAELVRLLCATGVDEVEATSFVSPRWVPQLGDAGELVGLLVQSPLPEGGDGASASARRDLSEDPIQRPTLSALVPNEKGMQALIDANERAGWSVISKVSVFTAASETFSRKNTNASIGETIERFRPVVEIARRYGLGVRGYVSCVIACPFEGAIAPGAVADVTGRLVRLGVNEIDLGDTIGAGEPETVRGMLSAVQKAVGTEWIGGLDPSTAFRTTLHLHDTFGRAADCVQAALDFGVRSFDSSAGGLGGCPYASTPDGGRAPGNISTQLLVRTVREAGYACDVDDAAMERAAAFAMRLVADARRGSEEGA